MPSMFRILSIDGGGIRGLIAARVIEHLEHRLTEAAGKERRMADYFHLMAGTSTGGLIALGLTTPKEKGSALPRLSGAELVRLYREDGPRVFRDPLRRILTLDGWIAPRHSLRRLGGVLHERLGEAALADALREVVITSYDMHGAGEGRPAPHFFRRWSSREPAAGREANPPVVDAGLATSAAPTFFPAHDFEGRALIDGGVFAANPTVAGIVEALKRRGGEDVAEASNLLVVALATGQHEVGYPARRLRRWGRVQWILPRGGEPALIAAILDGQSDAADHWAQVLLDSGVSVPGPGGTEQRRYFRFQTDLPRGVGLDDAREASLDRLDQAAERLLAERAADIDELVGILAPLSPLPPD
jgi:uncharacterized protein